MIFKIQNRLNGLAMLSIHGNIPVDLEEVLDELVRKLRKIT